MLLALPTRRARRDDGRLIALLALAGLVVAGGPVQAAPATVATRALGSKETGLWHAPLAAERSRRRETRPDRREHASSHTLRQHRDDPASPLLGEALGSVTTVLSRPSYVGFARLDAGAVARTIRRDARAAADREALAIARALAELPAPEVARIVEFFKHDYVQAYYAAQHRQATELARKAGATLARLPRDVSARDRERVDLLLQAATTVAAETRVLPIGGRMPRNSQFAGQVYPRELLPRGVRHEYPASVSFTADGFPDFSPYQIARARIPRFKGDATDFTEANRQAGLAATPHGYTWHHVQDGSTLILIPSDLHSAVQHTGGAAIAAYATAPDGYWHLGWQTVDTGRARVHK